MKKEDIIRKLTSRKLWVAFAGFVAGIIVACSGNTGTAETVSALIMSGASVIAYVIGEGLADSSHACTTVETNVDTKDIENTIGFVQADSDKNQ